MLGALASRGSAGGVQVNMTGLRSRVLRVLLLAAMLVLVVPAGVPWAGAAVWTPDTYWVDAVNGSNANPGTQSQPFESITHALTTVADPYDTLMVQPGTYDAANGETFPLGITGVTMIAVEGPEVTIIEGDLTKVLGVVQSMTQGDSIEGFTWTHGGGNGTGGALQVYLNQPTGANSPRIAGNHFVENGSVTYDGGAIRFFATALAVHNPLVVGNTFEGNTAQAGGALMVTDDVDLTVLDNDFIGNTAGFGGAIYATSQESTLTIDGNTFYDNHATSGSGGVVYASLVGGQTHTISSNMFEENSAALDGGALWLYSANSNITGNVALSCSAANNGGFAALEYTVATATNNMIQACAAGGEGAAWYETNAALHETNDTVVDCAGTADSALYPDTGGYAEVVNSIYWNSALTMDVEYLADLSYSDIRDPLYADASRNNTVGSGNVSSNPLFVDQVNHDLRLKLSSPCVDTASNADAPAADYYGTVRPTDGDGNGTATADMGFFERPKPAYVPLEGLNRFETAVEIAMASYESADTAVIASGMNFPDALSAAGLAGSYDAPLLLTMPDSVPAVVATALSDLGVSKVFVVGGTGAVSSAVFDALDASYDAERIWGTDRYQTAAKVAVEIASNEGAGFGKHVFIARGDSFPDALAVSPLAAYSYSPILLTPPDVLSAATQNALVSLDIESAVVVGGTGAVGGAVKSAIDAKLVANGGTASERWFGSDRYATAADVAKKGVEGGYAAWDCVGVATGEDYPDALAGGVHTGLDGGVVLLTPKDSLASAARTQLVANAEEIMYLDIYGGTGAVGSSVRGAIEAALGW